MKILPLLSVAFAVATSLPAAPLQLGANFNEHLTAARVPELDAGHTLWIRGFLPALQFIDGKRSLATDSGIESFRVAATTGRKVALTLKWDFLLAKVRVPAPDSSRETQMFDWAIAAARRVRPDMLLLVNEVLIDTEPRDLQPAADGSVPMVVFLQRLAARVAAAGLTTPSGEPLPLGCGGFTRTDTEATQKHPTVRAMLPWLARAPELSVVNYHLHQPTLEAFRKAAEFMHERLPDRSFVVTEFSLVWRYKRHQNDKIGAGASGAAFASAYGRDPDMTVVDYLNACVKHRVPEAEWNAFLASQPWFDTAFLEKACSAMERNGVALATYAYLQNATGGGAPFRSDGTPWRLNPVFVDRLAVSPDPKRPAVTTGFYETYLARQKR